MTALREKAEQDIANGMPALGLFMNVLANRFERESIESARYKKALEEIEQMAPGLIDGDSSCDMLAIVAGMALSELPSGE